MNATNQTASDCPNCGTELLADDSNPDAVAFECPACEAEYLGYVDDSGDGWAYIVDHRTKPPALKPPGALDDDELTADYRRLHRLRQQEADNGFPSKELAARMAERADALWQEAKRRGIEDDLV